jgi:replicative DNA helicase
MRNFRLQAEFVDGSAERGVIAAVAEEPELLWQLQSLIPEEAFCECADAWARLTGAIRSGQRTPTFEQWTAAGDPKTSAQYLADLFVRRCVAGALEEVAQQLYETQRPAQMLIACLEACFARVRSVVGRAKAGMLLSAADVLVEVMAEADARQSEQRRTGKPVMGLLTGIGRLDAILGGLGSGLYILGGPPSVGKTSFALQVSTTVAENTPVVFVTFENSAENLILRALCARAEVNTQDVRRGTADLAHLAAAAIEMKRDVAPRLAFIEGTLDLTVSDLRARAVELMHRQKTDRCLVVVDYLQVWGKGGIAYRHLETVRARVETFCSELRELAMGFRSPVMVLSSQNRQQGGYGDGGGRSSLDSFKESGDLEYTADVALFLVGSRSPTAVPPAHAVELNVRKNRDGDTGTIHLIFRPDISRFREQERDA